MNMKTIRMKSFMEVANHVEVRPSNPAFYKAKLADQIFEGVEITSRGQAEVTIDDTDYIIPSQWFHILSEKDMKMLHMQYVPAANVEVQETVDDTGVKPEILDTLIPRNLQGPETFQELVMQAMGEASVCWSELPQGVFDSTQAIKIAEKIVEWHNKELILAQEACCMRELDLKTVKENIKDYSGTDI